MRKRRPEDEREGDEEEREDGKPEEAPPIDVETMEALRAADPMTRKLSLLRIQRLHGNTTVQRVLRELESTEASREGRIQQIGERAEEPAPSGKLQRALLYRSEMEAEVEKVPVSEKTEREVVQDDVNTIGQIFANYQAALHLFEAEIGRDPATESVPRAVVEEFIDEFTQKFFGDILDIDLDAIPDLPEAVDRGIGAADEPADELKKLPKEGAPTNVLRNYTVAERERLAVEHKSLIKDQTMMMRQAVDELSTHDLHARSEQREELVRIARRVNEMEAGSHSVEWLFKQILDAWKDEIRDTSIVELELDERWGIRRAHIKGRNGRQLATELLGDNSGVFDLNELRLARRIVIRPAELAEIRVEMTPDGRIKTIWGNEKAQPHMEEVKRHLEREGLPETRRLTGD